MLPALRKIVDWIVSADRDHVLTGLRRTNAHGMRFPLELGGVSNVSAQTGSKWRSYQATYCSTMALGRGMSGHVVDASLAHYKDLAAISECFAIFGANSHDKPTGYEGWRRATTWVEVSAVRQPACGTVA